MLIDYTASGYAIVQGKLIENSLSLTSNIQLHPSSTSISIEMLEYLIGGDEKTEWPRRTDKCRTLKKIELFDLVNTISLAGCGIR